MAERRVRLVLLLAAAALVGGAAYWSLSPKNAPAAKGPPPPVPVTLARAALRDVPLQVDAVGRAEAYETVTLKARVDGQVSAVLFTEGQQVRAGDVLLRLDAADFEARLKQAEANQARDEALAAKARADVERYVALKARGFVSEEKINEMRTNAAAAEAAVRADRAAADLARLQLGYATLRAPFAGIVGARLVFPGTAVKANDTALAVVNRVRPLYVGFAIAEKHLPQLRAALATGALKMTVRVPGAGAETHAGEAHFLDNAVDPATGTIQMKATLPNADGKLTPGQFVNVALVLETVRDAVTVPAQAVQHGPQGDFLYVVRADATVEARPVEVLAVRDQVAAIGKGLAAGETIVADGHLRVTPGAKVKQAEAPAAAGQAAR